MLLLDVDGVVNANRPGWGGPPRQGNAYAAGRVWRMRWAPRLVDRLRALHLTGVVELRWCTTWCPQATQLEELMRLPELARTLTADDLTSQERSWQAKLSVALEVVEAERRPLVWVDDEAISAAPAAALGRLLSGPPVHLVTPSPNRGLQPADVDAIELFATTCG